MIFSAESIKKIKEGKKTMTRRPLTRSHLVVGYTAGKRIVHKKAPWKVGKHYAMQPGRGQEQVGRFTVTDYRLERLGEITTADARREGFLSTAAFLASWQRLYARGWQRRAGETDEQFDQRPKDIGCWPALSWQEVWVVSFHEGEIDNDQPRLLMHTGGHTEYRTLPRAAGKKRGRHTVAPTGDNQDYTGQPSLAMSGSADPGEALTAAQQEAMTARALARDKSRQGELGAALADLSLAERIAIIQKARQRQQVDVTGELRLIAQRVERAELLLESDAE